MTFFDTQYITIGANSNFDNYIGCHSDGPETSFPPVGEEGTAVLKNHELAQVPDHLFTAQVHHPLHPGITFLNEWAWQGI